MAVMPVYLYGTQVLRTKAKPIEGIDEKILELIHGMFETMAVADGLGLAANQVGVPVRLLIADTSGTEEGKGTSPFVIINPEILSAEGEDTIQEGCLSIPGIHEDVVRASKIHVRYRDGNFALKEMGASGLLARVILHETDHLDGVLFIDRIPVIKRSLLKAKLYQMKRGNHEATYKTVTAEEETRLLSRTTSARLSQKRGILKKATL